MTSEEALHVFGRLDRPAPVRNRAIPVVPQSDNRPWTGFALLVCAGCGFFLLLGAALAIVWSL